jgi:hypothetical protein
VANRFVFRPGVAPSVPTPTLAAAALSSSSIQLTAAYAGPPPLSTYTFQGAAASNGPWTTLGTQTSAVFTQTGLTASTRYYYRVNIQTAETPSRTSAWSAVQAVTTPASAGWASYSPNYPRNSSARLQPASANPAYGSVYLAWATSNQIFAAIGGNYVGAQPGFWPTTKDAFVQSMQAGGVELVNQYFDPSISSAPGTAGDNSSRPNYTTHISGNNWFLYLSGTSGTYASYIDNTAQAINPNWSEYVPTDSSGVAGSSTDKHGNFVAKWWQGQYYDGLGPYGSPDASQYCSTHLTGPYADDQWGFFWEYATPADISRSGSADTWDLANYTGAIGQSWRTGAARMPNQFLTDIPGAFLFCNQSYINDLIGLGISFTGAETGVLSQVNQLWHGMELQRYLGGTVDQYQNFATVMGGYQLAMRLCQAPKLVMVDIAYLQANGSGPQTWNSSTNEPATYTAAYVFMRYCTAFILMGTGMQSHDGFNDNSDQNLLAFDEWGGNTAQYPKGWIGQRVGGIQTTAAYGNGIWEARFYNSATNQYFRAVMNPRGNGAQTYNPGVTLYKMRGPQNPSYNNAASFTTLAMADPDGGIFCESAQ